MGCPGSILSPGFSRPQVAGTWCPSFLYIQTDINPPQKATNIVPDTSKTDHIWSQEPLKIRILYALTPPADTSCPVLTPGLLQPCALRSGKGRTDPGS